MSEVQRTGCLSDGVWHHCFGEVTKLFALNELVIDVDVWMAAVVLQIMAKSPGLMAIWLIPEISVVYMASSRHGATPRPQLAPIGSREGPRYILAEGAFSSPCFPARFTQKKVTSGQNKQKVTPSQF